NFFYAEIHSESSKQGDCLEEGTDGIERKLKENGTVLRDSFKVRRIGIFGFFARGEQEATSDIDILVDFTEPISLIEFVALERHLSEILGRKVDLVMRSALKPRIGKHILKEVRYL
ncbi:MAG: nucleotidyltransferase family protein, partial [Thermoplasmata archaeon]